MKLKIVTALAAAVLATSAYAASMADCCKEGAECCKEHKDCCKHEHEPKNAHQH